MIFTGIVAATLLTVGPGKTHAKPSAAIAAAKDGDTIEIDSAGDYKGDVAAVTKNNLTIKGVGGLAKLDADGKSQGGKAIWVVSGNDTTIESIEFTGAKVPDANGAGIRQEGKNLTVRGCSFHDNENGILAGDSADSTITIERSEFARNGAGDGYSHNLYINHVKSLVFRFNYSHDGKVGHLLKSRARTNVVSYNRITDEGGTASYEVDLPNAGTSFVIGNVIEQGEKTENPNIVAYGEEGVFQDWGTDLYVVNNTIVNRRAAGGTFVLVGGAITTPVKLINNIFFGKGAISTQGSAQQTTNYADADPKFADAAKYDFHLGAGSPCIDKGTAPPNAGATSLVPEFHYVHPLGSVGRKASGAAIDIGAYEVGGDDGEPIIPDAGASSSSSSGGGTAGPGGGTSSSSSGAAAPGTDGGASGAAPAGEDDGCSCRATRPRSDAALGIGALFALALVLRRRSPR